MPGDKSSRPARAGEEQDPDWRPVDDPTANPFQDYVRDLACLVYREAQQATDEVRRGGDERARGRLQAWTDAVALLMSQAEVFGMSAEDIGLPDQLDPGRDFSPETPSGRYAG